MALYEPSVTQLIMADLEGEGCLTLNEFIKHYRAMIVLKCCQGGYVTGPQ